MNSTHYRPTKVVALPRIEAILFGDDSLNSNADGSSGPIVAEQLAAVQEASGGLVSGVHVMLQIGDGLAHQRDVVLPALRKVDGIERISGFTMAPKSILSVSEEAAASAWLGESVKAADSMDMDALMWAGITPWLVGVENPQPFREVAVHLPRLARALARAKRKLRDRGGGNFMHLMLEPLSTHEVPDFPVISTLTGPILHAESLEAYGGRIKVVPDTAHQGRALNKGEVSPEQIDMMNAEAIASRRVEVVHISNPETRDEMPEFTADHPVTSQIEMYHRLGYSGRIVVEIIPCWPEVVSKIGLNEERANYKKSDFCGAIGRSMKAFAAKWNALNAAVQN